MYVPLNLDDCIVLREVHIYRGNPLETLGRVGCAYASGLTARRPVTPLGAAGGGNPNQHRCRPRGPLMSWAKPHAGGGPGAQVPIIQYKRNHSNRADGNGVGPQMGGKA
jgi:hypothetical protein